MPRVIDCPDTRPIALEECLDGLSVHGFDPADEASLHGAAALLRRLAANGTFLGDHIVSALAEHGRDADSEHVYGPQVVMLSPPGAGDCFVRANIWPAATDSVLRANGGARFVYGLPHDHNFDFLTVGYFGPGYVSDYYEYAYEEVTGYRGEPVALRFVETAALTQGKVLHYRAHRDVHAQRPPESLSVSLNVMHTRGPQGWLDQYAFDLERGAVARIVSNGSTDAFLRIAVGLGGAEALDLAERFAVNHPSGRLRLTALAALAERESDWSGQADIWRRAERNGDRLVRAEARAALAALEL